MGDIFVVIFAKTWSAAALSSDWLCPHGGKDGSQELRAYMVLYCWGISEGERFFLSPSLIVNPKKRAVIGQPGSRGPQWQRSKAMWLIADTDKVIVSEAQSVSKRENSSFDTEGKGDTGWQAQTKGHYDWFLLSLNILCCPLLLNRNQVMCYQEACVFSVIALIRPYHNCWFAFLSSLLESNIVHSWPHLIWHYVYSVTQMLPQWFSECGPWASSISIIWGLREVNSLKHAED